tara:strand:- start:22957 stop:23460 length:504 start_codon:yes stop_codon:yes gene_type:complete
MSQIQRYGEEYDGVIPGAPAIRYAQQQVQHLFSNVVEQTLDYYPSSCELQRIVNETISFCDPLDGKTDGVVSRTDLCKLKFNINSTIGLPYSCAASNTSSPMPGSIPVYTPAVNGTVTPQAVAAHTSPTSPPQHLRTQKQHTTLSRMPTTSASPASVANLSPGSFRK